MAQPNIVAIAAGAGFTSIPCTQACRHVHIEESSDQVGGFAPGYLQVQFKQHFGTAGFIEYTPGSAIELGNPIAEGNAGGTLQGLPGQNLLPTYAGGTTYAKDAVVLYSGVTYVSLVAANIGNQPDISPTKWLAFVQPNYRAADIYCKIRRTDSGATKVLVNEID